MISSLFSRLGVPKLPLVCRTFEALAQGVLDKCYADDHERTYDLLRTCSPPLHGLSMNCLQVPLTLCHCLRVLFTLFHCRYLTLFYCLQVPLTHSISREGV